MLGKLIKNEFRATGRTYLPLFGALVIMTIINKISFLIRPHASSLPQGLIMFGYVMLITAIFVITLVVTIQRFYKNLLGDEGYLMFTLPVRTWQLTLSKLIPAIVWTLLSVILSVVSIMFLAFSFSDYSNIFPFIQEFLQMVKIHSPISIWSWIFYSIVLPVLSLASGYLIIYVSIAIGHLANKNRLLASFGAFLAVNFIVQTIGTTLMWMVGNSLEGYVFSMSSQQAIHLGMWLIIAACAVMCAAFYFVTSYILSKRLNLE